MNDIGQDINHRGLSEAEKALFSHPDLENTVSFPYQPTLNEPDRIVTSETVVKKILEQCEFSKQLLYKAEINLVDAEAWIKKLMKAYDDLSMDRTKVLDTVGAEPTSEQSTQLNILNIQMHKIQTEISEYTEVLDELKQNVNLAREKTAQWEARLDAARKGSLTGGEFLEIEIGENNDPILPDENAR